jgi:anti-anti-sigma factor
LIGKFMQIFTRETIRQFTVLTMEIETLDGNNTQRVSNRLLEAMQRGEQIVVDLGALRYFDVTGFAAILSWVVRCPVGSEVRLCSQSGNIHALFELLRAESVVSLYSSREDAFASLAQATDRTEHRSDVACGQQVAAAPKQRIAV